MKNTMLPCVKCAICDSDSDSSDKEELASMMSSSAARAARTARTAAVLACCLVMAGSARAADYEHCVAESACSCKYSNGSRVVVPEKVVSAGGVQAQGATSVVDQYFVSLCRDRAFSFNDSSNRCGTTSVCVKRLQVTPPLGNGSFTVKDDGYFSNGNVASSKFVFGDSKVMLMYQTGAVTTSILLVCAPYDDVLAVNDLGPANIILTLYSPSLCLTAADTRHSLGTTLLIIFFVLGLLYFGVGYAVKYSLMGARGAEAVPNYAFWKDYPDLVREGILFIQNGFKPPARSAATPNSTPNPNSYDSI